MNVINGLVSAEKKTLSWFHKQKDSAEKLFIKIEPVMERTQKYVNRLSEIVDAETKALGSPAVLVEVEAFLHVEIAVYDTVNVFVAQHRGATVASILHDAAKLLIQHLPEAKGLLVHELDTAVQVAYSVSALSK